MNKSSVASDGVFDGAVQAATAAVGAAATGVATATGVAASAVFNTAEAAVKGTAGAAGAVAKGTADTAGAVASGVADQVRAADRRLLRTAQSLEKRYYQTVSPIVEGQGGDFGKDDGADILNQVVLNMEIVGSEAVKRMQRFSLVLSLFALAATIALCVLKYKTNPSLAVQGPRYFKASVIVACIFLAALLGTAALFISRVVEAWHSGRVWSRRRAYVSAAAFTVLALQILNLVFMVAAGSYSLAHTCGWRDQVTCILGYLQWTCWNVQFTVFLVLAHNGCTWRGKTAADGGQAQEEGKTQTEVAALVLDAPLSVHALKLSYVIIFQTIITILLWTLLSRLDRSTCETLTSCKPVKLTIIMLSLLMVLVWASVFIYLYYAWRADADIKSRPYAEMRFARMVYALQHDQIRPVFVSLALCMVLLTCISIGSCWTYVETWLGVIPLQTVGTSMAATFCFFFMPKSPRSNEQVLQSWLQEFAWTAASLPDAIKERNRKLAGSASLAAEPMFCMETAIKLFYFANWVYSCPGNCTSKEEPQVGAADVASGSAAVLDDVSSQSELASIKDVADIPAPPVVLGLGNMDGALAQYDLTDWEVIVEPKTDSKALLAWNADTLVVAFKGTSSMENIKTDINFLKTDHLPHRTAATTKVWGARLIKLPVRVHRGFYAAWTDEGFNQRILNRVGTIMAGMQTAPGGSPRLLLTGHSLGGALATLCAHDLRTSHKNQELTVYTYGEPRVGNRAFSCEYNSLVPAHFAVINDQDPVSRQPKGWYKRVGDRVIINEQGDIAVRPSYLEVKTIKHAAAGVPRHHVCEFYRLSMMRIILSQFTPRMLRGGTAGATALAKALNLNAALLASNMDLESLQDPESEPITEEEEERRLAKKAVLQKTRSTRISCNCRGGGETQAGEEDEHVVRQEARNGEPDEVSAASL